MRRVGHCQQAGESHMIIHVIKALGDERKQTVFLCGLHGLRVGRTDKFQGEKVTMTAVMPDDRERGPTCKRCLRMARFMRDPSARRGFVSAARAIGRA